MKNTIIGLLLLGLVSMGAAQEYWSAKKYDFGVTNSYCVIPPQGKATTIYAYQDSAAVSKARLFQTATAGAAKRVTAATLQGTNVSIATNGFVVGDVIAIEDVSANEFLLRGVHLRGATNLSVTNMSGHAESLSLTLAAGDRVYLLEQAADLGLGIRGNVTLTAAGGGIVWYAEKGPSALCVWGSGASTNVSVMAAGYY